MALVGVSVCFRDLLEWLEIIWKVNCLTFLDFFFLNYRSFLLFPYSRFWFYNWLCLFYIILSRDSWILVCLILMFKHLRKLKLIDFRHRLVHVRICTLAPPVDHGAHISDASDRRQRHFNFWMYSLLGIFLIRYSLQMPWGWSLIVIWRPRTLTISMIFGIFIRVNIV